MVTRKDLEAPAGEAEVFIDWVSSLFTFPGGEQLDLRRQSVRIKNMNFGPFADGIMISVRNTQAI